MIRHVYCIPCIVLIEPPRIGPITAAIWTTVCTMKADSTKSYWFEASLNLVISSLLAVPLRTSSREAIVRKAIAMLIKR